MVPLERMGLYVKESHYDDQTKRSSNEYVNLNYCIIFKTNKVNRRKDEEATNLIPSTLEFLRE